MTATAPEPTKTKIRRKDCYVARLTVRIPLDMANADSLAGAIKAVSGLKAHLPPDAIIEGAGQGTLGKM